MGYKSYSIVTCANPTEGATKNIGEGLHCIQGKTSHALWTDAFELPDNKNIGKCFSKNEIFFLDHVHYSFDPSQILIIQYPIPRACLLSFKFQPGQLKLFFNTIFNMFFIGFSILPYPMQTRHNYYIPNHMPSQANQFLYQAIYKS